MTKALMLVRHAPKTWMDLFATPEDRSDLVRRAVEATGAQLEAMQMLIGEYDAFVVLSAPNSVIVGAAALALTAIGGFVDVKVLTIVDAGDVPAFLGAAAQALSVVPTALG